MNHAHDVLKDRNFYICWIHISPLVLDHIEILSFHNNGKNLSHDGRFMIRKCDICAAICTYGFTYMYAHTDKERIFSIKAVI